MFVADFEHDGFTISNRVDTLIDRSPSMASHGVILKWNQGQTTGQLTESLGIFDLTKFDQQDIVQITSLTSYSAPTCYDAAT